MAKAYVEATKYEVKIKFQIKGVVDKPDIVGAIFGQSEGLLGEEMDLRELQKSGRIGRIEVEAKQDGGNTFGQLLVPSSMDMAETSVLAAAIETVDKVGPCEAAFSVQSIDDVRQDKRAEIAKRAKELLNRLKDKQGPQIDDLTEEVRLDARVEKITEYGRDRLPAGPEVDAGDEVIVVEGRADVINLLRCGIKNAIAMGGSRIPRDIITLSQRKTITLFADGDRGGELNARKLHQIANVAFVAVAPDGKEVEELQQKEIIQALHRKKPVEEFLNSIGVSERESRQGMHHDAPHEMGGHYDERRGYGRDNGRDGGRDFGGREFGGRPMRGDARGMRRPMMNAPRPNYNYPDASPPMEREFVPSSGDMGNRRPLRPMRSGGAPQQFHHSFGKNMDENPLGLGMETPRTPSRVVENKSLPEEASSAASAPAVSKNEFAAHVQKVRGKLIALFLDEKGKQVQEVPVKEMVDKLKSAKNVHTIVADGIVTKRLYDAAEKANVNAIVAIKKGKVSEGKVKIIMA